MRPSATSPFNIPDRLSVKTDPQLIAHDDQHLSRIADSLRQKITDLTGRLSTLRREPGGRGQAGVQRDAEIHRYARQLNVLQRFGMDLCLGRIVRTDHPEPIYIGRSGLTDSDGRRLLVDWRAPAAEPFFAATHATTMGLISRRRYRWAHGQVVDYWDEVFAPEELNGRAALDDQSAFIASLGASRSPQMRDVLATIQADQDAIIRAGSLGALVVDGGPGTGKTVVALHRAARLIYSEPRLTSGRGGLLFIGPTQAYRSYVEDVLPSLGEDNVQICTLRDFLVEGNSAIDEPDPEVAHLKSSRRLLEAIEVAVTLHEQPPTQGMSVETPWADLWIGPEEWREAFDAVDPGTPHNQARPQVWESLVEILTDKIDGYDELSISQLRKYAAQDEELQQRIVSAWPLLDPTSVVADLWSAPEYLGKCAPWLTPKELELLQREEPRAWTVSDLPLLDAARQRIGDPEHARQERRRQAAINAEREQMSLVVDDLISADRDGNDGEGLVTMLRQDDLQRPLVDDAALPHTDPDILAGPFGHIIVDEAQELTDTEWDMVLRRCPSRSLTIVGDRAQARQGFTETWQERLQRVGLQTITRTTLSINYRTPKEIMAEAGLVIRRILPDANVPESIRNTGIPVTQRSASDLDQVIQDWLVRHEDGIACVIGAPAFAARPRVRSMMPEDVKGLEFDFVVLVEPDDLSVGGGKAVDHYVAMTRATQQLVILTHS
ncbi:RNA polymerase recycling motor ATPase HelR [Nesterenkonia haasae]|uniref:RNA polymerase recycling motor ATPase HelR n=1 Tax=Nesterenkonia haasae TaxID=2587813 RepID=UPI001391AB0E|nr:RNA polymerase recycling motor ATPase HelR [Nesterenkonia haasae]NDK31727.1 AAA family ATPase [Nesterenkonia haasae]